MEKFLLNLSVTKIENRTSVKKGAPAVIAIVFVVRAKCNSSFLQQPSAPGLFSVSDHTFTGNMSFLSFV